MNKPINELTNELREEMKESLVLPLSSVPSTKTNWVWQYLIPLGKITQLAGQAGMGKSSVAISIAATVSTGGQWCDGSECKKGKVLIFSGEDDFSQTVKPRLEAQNANLDNIFIYRKDIFDLTSCLHELEEIIVDEKISLIIIDPISSFYGPQVKPNDNASVRESLTPVTRILEENQTAMIVVNHLNKKEHASGLEKILGAGSLAALSRAVYMVNSTNDENRNAIFTPVKCNLAPPQTSIKFTIESYQTSGGIETSRVKWGSEISQDQLTGFSTSNSPPSETKMVANLIIEIIKENGDSMQKSDISSKLLAEGFSQSTINNAFNRHSDKIIQEKWGIYTLADKYW